MIANGQPRVRLQSSAQSQFTQNQPQFLNANCSQTTTRPNYGFVKGVPLSTFSRTVGSTGALRPPQMIRPAFGPATLSATVRKELEVFKLKMNVRAKNKNRALILPANVGVWFHFSPFRAICIISIRYSRIHYSSVKFLKHNLLRRVLRIQGEIRR